MFEMGIATEGTVEMGHAEGEGGGEYVDIFGGYVGARERGGCCAVCCVWGGEVLGEVGEDWC